MPYFDVILTFVFETSTFNYPNSKYLEIFTFIRIDFMCFSDKGLLEINSVFRQKIVVFFYADNWQKAITTDTTKHDSTDCTTILIAKR